MDAITDVNVWVSAFCGVFIRTVKVHLQIIYGDSWIAFIVCLSLGSSGMG